MREVINRRESENTIEVTNNKLVNLIPSHVKRYQQQT